MSLVPTASQLGNCPGWDVGVGGFPVHEQLPQHHSCTTITTPLVPTASHTSVMPLVPTASHTSVMPLVPTASHTSVMPLVPTASHTSVLPLVPTASQLGNCPGWDVVVGGFPVHEQLPQHHSCTTIPTASHTNVLPLVPTASLTPRIPRTVSRYFRAYPFFLLFLFSTF